MYRVLLCSSVYLVCDHLRKKKTAFGVAFKSSGSDLNKNRKEVIQPHVPVRLPCYDLAPIMKFTVTSTNVGASGAPHFQRLTGGVYKARERIHGVVADTPLLAIPAS
jgi:hypothetical protein